MIRAKSGKARQRSIILLVCHITVSANENRGPLPSLAFAHDDLWAGVGKALKNMTVPSHYAGRQIMAS